MDNKLSNNDKKLSHVNIKQRSRDNEQWLQKSHKWGKFGNEKNKKLIETAFEACFTPEKKNGNANINVPLRQKN